MDGQEHIATLCAAGTVGIAAAGLALGIPDHHASPALPGKRKFPGASSIKPPQTPQTPHVLGPAVTEQQDSAAPSERSRLSHSASRLRRRPAKDLRPHTAASDESVSRESSRNRAGLLRPRTADTRSGSTTREVSAGSSWLKRISTVSSLYGSSQAASTGSQPDASDYGDRASPSEPRHKSAPNKLVKRSTSHRHLSPDQGRGILLRRPATSHQRSMTFSAWDERSRPPSPTTTSSPIPRSRSTAPEYTAWRPLFDRAYPRKRRSTPGERDTHGVRTISAVDCGQPTLILGSSVEPRQTQEDGTDQRISQPPKQTLPAGRHRLRRSLSSMRRTSPQQRVFTDPVGGMARQSARVVMSSSVRQSPLALASNAFADDPELPRGSPIIKSSPPVIPVRHRFSFRKRESTAPSDPTTISSDNDTRVFTDDDSMDFQSDTAYDSLATRATSASQAGLRSTKLDAMFTENPVQSDGHNKTLEQMMQRTSLSGSDTDQRPWSNYGIGIIGIDEHSHHSPSGTNSAEEPMALTPVKPVSVPAEDQSLTPIPISYSGQQSISWTPHKTNGERPDDVSDDHFSDREAAFRPAFGDDLDWSPKSSSSRAKPDSPLGAPHSRMPTVPGRVTFQQQGLFKSGPGDQRVSLFDWSENARGTVDAGSGLDARPKTVHGKQANDATRSRSSGRKGPGQIHMRSQSVPTHRDALVEPATRSSSKFGTWGLGNKPVSEEWSDDFEFDDGDEENEKLLPLPPIITTSSVGPGSARGVKVPQAIIDRQASVHLQFGQVQEFMLLVEELKQLRVRGSKLGLLESHSRQLWEDAESIINLATINNEEIDEPAERARSPNTQDVETDTPSGEASEAGGRGLAGSHNRSVAGQRAVSANPATPPHGRARGESLAQAKNFLQTIHSSRSGPDSSPPATEDHSTKKLPFDTQDLKDLVTRSGVITRALKEIVRRAEGLTVSPSKTPIRARDPPFSEIFNAPEISSSPTARRSGLPKSKSANSYLSEKFDEDDDHDIHTLHALVTTV